MEEIWKNINENYQVSNTGKVKSLARKCVSGHGWRIVEEKILNTHTNNNGYLLTCVYPNKRKTTLTIHRLVAEAFIPNPDNLPEVNHKDGDKTNNNDWNLEWVSSSNNKLHAFKLGLMNQKGSKNACSKLTEKDVLEIRSKYVPRKYSTYKLAKEYGVDDETIRGIVNNQRWTHI